MKPARCGIALLVAAWLQNSVSAHAARGDHFNLQPADLPPAGTTLPLGLTPNFDTPAPGLVPQVPVSFAFTQFVSKAGYIRSLALAPEGDVFVVRPQSDVLHRRNSHGDGRAGQVQPCACGFKDPHGIAIRDGQLYISDGNAVWHAPYRDHQTIAFADLKPVTAAPDLRPEGLHTTRDIVFDPAGKLYLAFGSRDDLIEAPPPDASIQLIADDGTMSTFASGLRNVEGLAFYLGSNDLWVAVNEPDALGARVPADFLAHLRANEFFGWPYAYNGPIPDPVFGAKRPDMVAKTRTPGVLFEAHSAPLGLVLYTGSRLPVECRNDGFVAIHGSGPPDNPDDYKVVRVRFKDGKPVGSYEDFVTGFFRYRGSRVSMWGSPSQLAVAITSSLLCRG